MNGNRCGTVHDRMHYANVFRAHIICISGGDQGAREKDG